MRVAVIGAGAVGGTLAALLARAGHDVVVTARGDQLGAIIQRGLRISGAWGTDTVRVAAAERLTRSPELALVTTKAQDAEEAMRASAHLLGEAPVVVVQNGLTGLDTARRVLPASHVLGGLAVFAASYLSPGQITVTARGRMYLGGEQPGSGHASTVASDVLGGVLPTEVLADFAGAQWTKLVINQVNALPAITGLSVQDVIAESHLRRVMTASMREAVRAGLASGVRFGSIQGLNHGLLRAFASAPYGIAQLLPRAMARRMGSVPNPGSTLQSIRRGQRTEIDFLNGAVIGAAERAGMPAPINAALVGLVHEVERSGHFIPADAVLARMTGDR